MFCSNSQAVRQLRVPKPGQPIRNFSIPTTAFGNDAGSFTTRLTLAKSQRVMLALSDALGVASGGISALLTVGDSISGNSCNTSSPGTFEVVQAFAGIQLSHSCGFLLFIGYGP